MRICDICGQPGPATGTGMQVQGVHANMTVLYISNGNVSLQDPFPDGIHLDACPGCQAKLWKRINKVALKIIGKMRAAAKGATP
jgi:hypothetical protein